MGCGQPRDGATPNFLRGQCLHCYSMLLCSNVETLPPTQNVELEIVTKPSFWIQSNNLIEVAFPSGFDIDVGSWSIMESEPTCEEDFQQIWQGYATIYSELDEINVGSFLAINDSETSTQFVTNIERVLSACGSKAFKTQYDNVIVIPMTDTNPGLFLEPLSPLNGNIMNAVASSATFLKHSFSKGMNSLIRELEFSECIAQKNNLEAELVIAGQLISSNLLNQDRGYMVVERGQILQITQCPEALATKRDSQKCWTDLPVKFKQKDVFLDSITNIFKDISNEIECNQEQCSIFKIGSSYFKQCPTFELIKKH